MSENKRSKKYNNLKETKRTVILAKKDNKDGGDFKEPEAPKILLKSKNKPIPTGGNTINTPQTNQTQPISIAIREHSEYPSIIPSPNSKKLLSSSITTAANTSNIIQQQNNPEHYQQSHYVQQQQTIQLQQQPQIQQNNIPQMQKSMPLITDHYHLNSQVMQDYLQETNNHFIVIGIIGEQNTGKSTILNILGSIDEVQSGSGEENKDQNKILHIQDQQVFSPNPSTEGIHMYITKNRTILLDCSPLLCNPYKKDFHLNEIDDLKLLIFLMNICHHLIIVQNSVNLNLLRLVHCAEIMKPSLDKNITNEEYFCNLIFVKNMASLEDFAPELKERQMKFYRNYFANCPTKQMAFSGGGGSLVGDVNIYQNTTDGIRIKKNDAGEHQRVVDYFIIPQFLTGKSPQSYKYYADKDELAAQFRQTILMSSRQQLPNPTTTPIMSEKIWSLLVQASWESHKNNYFLRKYENFKEHTNRPAM